MVNKMVKETEVISKEKQKRIDEKKRIVAKMELHKKNAKEYMKNKKKPS